MAHENEESKIVEFFRNSTVFLTGVTGFIGKVVLSKLFLTCKVSRVYFLIRKKSSKSGAERMRELFEDEVFLQLKNSIPDFEDRVKLIEGDCSLENLGISNRDQETLYQSVDFVFHCAAALDIFESCKSSVEINIRGTQGLVNLAKNMTNLKAFVHVSSLATYWDRDIIDEKLYESHLEYEDCLNLLKIDHVLPMDKHDKKRVLGKKWMFYSLTKAAAESIFIREKLPVPVVIFRFPFASASWKEPIPGFMQGFHGPNGLVILSLLDITPFCPWNDGIVDVIPVDFVANALIAVTLYSHDEFINIKESNEKSLFVFNYSTKTESCKNGLSMQYLLSKMNKDHDFTFNLHSNKMIYTLWCLMFGYIPALVIDFFAALFGRKLGLFETCNYLVDLNLRFMRSTFISYQVNDENVQSCLKSLSDIDKKLFPFDINEFEWKEYLPRTYNSIQEYIRRFLEKDKNMRLAIFWLPKLQSALRALYFMLFFYIIHLIYTKLD